MKKVAALHHRLTVGLHEKFTFFQKSLTFLAAGSSSIVAAFQGKGGEKQKKKKKKKKTCW